MSKAKNPDEKLRIGTVSNEEVQFVKDNLTMHSVDWIASQIKRNKDTVQSIIDNLRASEYINNQKNKERSYVMELRSRKYWPEIQKQFNGSELDLFEDYFTRYMEQFKGDILASEEVQIVDLIRYEMLINRNLKEQAQIARDIEKYQKEYKEYIKRPKDQQKDSERFAIQGLLVAAQGASKNQIDELTKMQAEKNRLFKELKATRSERVKVIEDSKQTIFGLFKMLDDYSERLKEGRRSELFKMAVTREKERLYTPHKYEDGSLDIPVLNSESVENLYGEEAIVEPDKTIDNDTGESEEDN